ncbi:MbtH family NRPS accessory protein [Streptomyces sp. MZ04]|uniref:MbtH family NRPS accessory protein n=1 Tax=Streptomyces sp. MZ04 TaxID=2559236 RepID=UPI00107E9B39|nr:MbtH family NRPS accessory protein [Streptomyces sp. MZ04]TGB13586.1 MbtH family protein [Streptomyces sp. MZ04]
MTTTPGPFDPAGQDDPAEPTHLVLENALGEHSLWPVFRPAPEGWRAVYGPEPYGRCVARLQDPPA